jgi:hypothetical protein
MFAGLHSNQQFKEKAISQQQHELIRKYIQRDKEKDSKIDKLDKHLHMTNKILTKCRDDFRKVNEEAILKSSQIEVVIIIRIQIKTNIKKTLRLQVV